jgi:uncharacterized membrane protein (Fun14 family)
MGEQEMMNEMMQDAMEAPPVMPPAQASPGMLDSIKQNLNVQNIMDKVRHSKDKLFEAGLYAGIGFISGFLLKKYSTYVLVCALVLIGLGVLQHLEVINVMINWDKVNDVFGIQAAQTVTADSIIATMWEWIKLNIIISVSYLVGLFIGLKVG